MNYSRNLPTWLHIITVAAVAVLLNGCSIFKNDDAPDLPVEEMYAIAKENMDKNNWLTAIADLQKLEAKYPYGAHAEQAKLDTAYAHYRNGDSSRGLAVTAAERFIKEHPTHPFVAYAYYIKGLALYLQNDSTFGRIIGRDDLSDRDAGITRDALNAFADVYELFPASRYAADARARATKLREALARHEVIVAAFYFSRRANVAVVNRAKGVVENFPDAAAVEPALALLVYAYTAMGLADLADSSQRVLRTNFPESEYLGGGGRAALQRYLQKVAPLANYADVDDAVKPPLLKRLNPFD